MNSFNELVKSSQTFVHHNSPAILTALGVTGVVTTGYLAGRAGYRLGQESIWEHERDESFFENAKRNWKMLVPPVAAGATTVAAIIAANRISSTRATAVASALTLTDKAFNEYREKVVEQIGVNKEQKVRDEVATEAATRDISQNVVVVNNDTDITVYETYTGRFFQSNVEALRRAQNEFNQIVISDYYASLNDFYDLIDLGHTTVGEEVGWNAENLLDLQFTSMLTPDMKPMLAVGYRRLPIPNYNQIG